MEGSRISENPYQLRNKRFLRSQDASLSRSTSQNHTRTTHRQPRSPPPSIRPLPTLAHTLPAPPTRLPDQPQSQLVSLTAQLQQRDKRIAELQQLLAAAAAQRCNLEDQRQKQQRRASEEFEEWRVRAAEAQRRVGQGEVENYGLRQQVKRLEIELACTSRKWTLECDRINREKDAEIRSLKEKYSQLIRRNREKNKNQSVLSNFTPIGSAMHFTPMTSGLHAEIELELSSFELSS